MNVLDSSPLTSDARVSSGVRVPSGVRVHLDDEGGGGVVDLEIDIRRAGVLMSAIAEAVRGVQAIIERLELRPRLGTLAAHIVVAPTSELEGSQPRALVRAILAAIEAATQVVAAPEVVAAPQAA